MTRDKCLAAAISGRTCIVRTGTVEERLDEAFVAREAMGSACMGDGSRRVPNPEVGIQDGNDYFSGAGVIKQVTQTCTRGDGDECKPQGQEHGRNS